MCNVCGEKVEGSGYTNHCTRCLWSLHVDESVPGDRKSRCRGMMEPIGVMTEAGENIIIHKCQKCGKKTRNKTSRTDNFEAILNLSEVA